MSWVFVKIQESSVISPSNQPLFLLQPPPPPPLTPFPTHDSSGSNGGLFNLNNKVSPSILLVIIILAIIFFISGLLHLLVRFLLRPTTRDPDDLDNVTALQGQLQQLFHLHDSGVDQSFIDTLPVFNYKSIIGVKDPFDCAVCLCEFEPEDKLRLLPKCSHAFHMECIDTWLLSHSTCPLCRASLLPDFSSSNNNHSCSPIVFVLESGSESSRENIVQNSHEFGSLRRNNSISRLSLSSHFEEINVQDVVVAKTCDEIQGKVEEVEKVVQVKLGKFKNVEPQESEEGSSNNIDSRRCFSMGSFAYVLDETRALHVPIRKTPSKKSSNKKPNLPPLTPGHRQAMSECGCDSRREFNGFEGFKFAENPMQNNINVNENKILENGSCKRESFSVSKIWLRAKKDENNNSRRAFSFRFPVSRNIPAAAVPGGSAAAKNGIGGGGGSRRTISEIDIGTWEKNGGCDEENQCYNRLEFQPKTPSFARRTLLWLMGKQNKVVHSSFSSNL
ncbi:PREDICTED: RING-H2 finger protein ATL13-like [Nicotiana attenuata]|uniref:RING-type E3 ubiquitin transferase n=1 Tax=Nicotiana attenuata TaxID=49451 RepID=A0A1J6HY73_NICAT|nr:PREDICTED: RING-H2 finger protein ATL13-like [Nicotiana attenuata]OIS97289.1 ring-h2 finger protein atl13 [Nicotiana attenuata]